MVENKAAKNKKAEKLNYGDLLRKRLSRRKGRKRIVKKAKKAKR